MKKLKLNLDELKVESFETKERKEEKGTVLGNDYSYPPQFNCGSGWVTFCHADPRC